VREIGPNATRCIRNIFLYSATLTLIAKCGDIAVRQKYPTDIDNFRQPGICTISIVGLIYESVAFPATHEAQIYFYHIYAR
jgi:hypothetical protein